MALILYAVYTFLTVFNAGSMTSLQIQHYGIYPFVGKEDFKIYIAENNKSAFIPAMVPGILMHLLSVVLIFYRPGFMTTPVSITSLILNIIVFFSTFKWQRPLQAQMANDDYDEEKIRLLLSTNWIRTVTLILLGILTISILASAK